MDTIIVRPVGAIAIAEWGNDRHRLIARPSVELAAIQREMREVRRQLRIATARNIVSFRPKNPNYRT